MVDELPHGRETMILCEEVLSMEIFFYEILINMSEISRTPNPFSCVARFFEVKLMKCLVCFLLSDSHYLVI